MYAMNGWFLKGTIALGTSYVIGRSLLPCPPTRTTAFIAAGRLQQVSASGYRIRGSTKFLTIHLIYRFVDTRTSTALRESSVGTHYQRKSAHPRSHRSPRANPMLPPAPRADRRRRRRESWREQGRRRRT